MCIKYNEVISGIGLFSLLTMQQEAETGVGLLCCSKFMCKHDEAMSVAPNIECGDKWWVPESTCVCEQRHCLNILLL